MKAVELAEAASSLAKYARRADKNPVLLTVEGKPVAALVGLDGVDVETLSLCSDPKFVSIIKKARARYRKEGGVSSAVLRERLKKARKPPKKAANSTPP